MSLMIPWSKSWRSHAHKANGEKNCFSEYRELAEFGFTDPDEVIHDFWSWMARLLQQLLSESQRNLLSRKAIMQMPVEKIPNGILMMFTLEMSEWADRHVQGLLTMGWGLVLTPDYPHSSRQPSWWECVQLSLWWRSKSRILRQCRKFNLNTKAVVVINPITQQVLTFIQMRSCFWDCRDCRQISWIIFADGICDRLVMDGWVHTAIAKLAIWSLLGVSMNGLSHRIAGFRVGWWFYSDQKQYAAISKAWT